MSPDPYLRLPEVEAEVGLKKSVIYKLRARGDFPAGVLVSRGARRWRMSQIQAWKQAKDDEPHPA